MRLQNSNFKLNSFKRGLKLLQLSYLCFICIIYPYLSINTLYSYVIMQINLKDSNIVPHSLFSSEIKVAI